VTLIHSIEIDIASTYAEDLFILLLPPITSGRYDEYVPMEDTRASDGSGDYDMGMVAGDASLSNVAPYIFVETGGLDFTAPYSSPSIFSADKWGSGNHERGDWNLQIFDNSEGDKFSIGDVTITYCSSSCEAISFPTLEGETSPPPSTDGSIPTQTGNPSSSSSIMPQATPQPQTMTAEPTIIAATTAQPTQEPTSVSTTATSNPTSPLPSFRPSTIDMSGTGQSSGSEDTMTDTTSSHFAGRGSVCCIDLMLLTTYMLYNIL
jgi:subtilisin-like proprotein convertase family protein